MPLHYGAGLMDIFQLFRGVLPVFKNELLFRGFLIAFGFHVQLTLEQENRSSADTHWWKGPIKGSNREFLDSSQGGVRRVFDEKGRLRLAVYLAGKTFAHLEQYFAIGRYAEFLKSAAVTVGRDYLETHIEEIRKGSLEKTLLRVRTLTPQFALPDGLVEDERRKGISETKLAKRSPKIKPIAHKKAMSSNERNILWRDRLSVKQKDAQKIEKALRRKELRAAKK